MAENRANLNLVRIKFADSEISLLEKVYKRVKNGKTIKKNDQKEFADLVKKFTEVDEEKTLLTKFQDYLKNTDWEEIEGDDESEEEENGDSRNCLNPTASALLTALKLSLLAYTIYSISRAGRVEFRAEYGTLKVELIKDEPANKTE